MSQYEQVRVRYGPERGDLDGLLMPSVKKTDSPYVGWIEIVGGIRVDIYRGLTMGWSVRLKTAFHAKNKTQLWWTPGYGFTQGAQFAFNYTLGYTLRTKAERAKTATQTDRKDRGRV